MKSRLACHCISLTLRLCLSVCVDGSWRRGESSVCLCARRYDTRENLIVPHRTRIQKAFAAAAADRRHRAGNFVGCWLQGKIVSRSVPDLLPVVWIQRLMEPIMIRSRLLNVCILNKNAFNVYVASLYSAPRHVEPIHTYVPLKKNNFRSLIFCSRVRCETLKGQAMRRISQSLIRIWWRYDECASGLFTSSSSSSFIQFLFFLCVGCDSRLDHWLVFHHALIKDGLRPGRVFIRQTRRRGGNRREAIAAPLAIDGI